MMCSMCSIASLSRPPARLQILPRRPPPPTSWGSRDRWCLIPPSAPPLWTAHARRQRRLEPQCQALATPRTVCSAAQWQGFCWATPPSHVALLSPSFLPSRLVESSAHLKTLLKWLGDVQQHATKKQDKQERKPQWSDLVSRTDSGDRGKEAEEAGRIGEVESEEVPETAAMRWTKSTELEALPRTDMKRPWNWVERLTSSSSSWELVWWLRLMHVGPHTIPSSRGRALRSRIHREGTKESPGQEHRKKKSTSNSKGKGGQHNERTSSKTVWRTSQAPPVSASSLRYKPQNPRNYFQTPELESKRYTFALSEVNNNTIYIYIHIYIWK